MTYRGGETVQTSGDFESSSLSYVKVAGETQKMYVKRKYQFNAKITALIY